MPVSLSPISPRRRAANRTWSSIRAKQPSGVVDHAIVPKALRQLLEACRLFERRLLANLEAQAGFDARLGQASGNFGRQLSPRSRKSRIDRQERPLCLIQPCREYRYGKA